MIQRQRAAAVDVDFCIQVDGVVGIQREFVLAVADVGIDVDVACICAVVGFGFTGVGVAVAGGNSDIARAQRVFNHRGVGAADDDVHRVDQPFAAVCVDFQVFVDADGGGAGVDEFGLQRARGLGFTVLHVGNQQDFSVPLLQRIRLNRAAVADDAGRQLVGGLAGHDDLPAIGNDELFVVDQGLDSGGVYLYVEQPVRACLQGDLVACGHDDAAELGADDAVVAHRGGQQGNTAAILGSDFTLIDDAAGGAAPVEGVVAVFKISVADVHGAGNEAAHIDLAACTEYDAVGVDEPHLPIRIQLPVNLAGIALGDAVQGDGAAVVLVEGDTGVFADVEAGPVDDGFAAALVDRHLAAGLADFGLPCCHMAAGGQSMGGRGRGYLRPCRQGQRHAQDDSCRGQRLAGFGF